MKRIINTWYRPMQGNQYFNVDEPIFKLGNYRIFEQTKECYLHTFNDVAITQLVKPNKELIKQLINNTRPSGKYTSAHFIYDRAVENKRKGLKIKEAIKIEVLN